LCQGIEPRDDFPAQPLFEEFLKEKHLLIAKHTRRHLREEIHFPGPVIERANLSRWTEEGSQTLAQRAGKEIDRLLQEYTPSRLPDDVKQELERLMAAEANRVGMDRLPERGA
jgi:trimethylamine:corrinoid methyltransferase-like protein